MKINPIRTLEATFRPDAVHRKTLDQGAKADIHRCWTCGSCDFECPVNAATGRLRPQMLVRMANFGMIEELLKEPSIWYCQSCRRCLQICPNTVKPSELISHIRLIALERNLASIEKYRSYRMLFARFQRVRKKTTEKSFTRELKLLSVRQWCDWLLTSETESVQTIHIKAAKNGPNGNKSIASTAMAAACFTCGECSSACPIACERSVFDPRSLFRMFNLGLIDELLENPSIWLCLDCGRCTDACSQLVDGREIIRWLRKVAQQRGIADRNFFLRLEQANRLVYSRWLEEVDALFSTKDKFGNKNSAGLKEFSVCCREHELAAPA